MAQELLFELGDVRITPHLAQFGGTSYQISNIGSVRVIGRRKRNPVAVTLFLLHWPSYQREKAKAMGRKEERQASRRIVSWTPLHIAPGTRWPHGVRCYAADRVGAEAIGSHAIATGP